MVAARVQAKLASTILAAGAVKVKTPEALLIIQPEQTFQQQAVMLQRTEMY